MAIFKYKSESACSFIGHCRKKTKLIWKKSEIRFYLINISFKLLSLLYGHLSEWFQLFKQNNHCFQLSSYDVSQSVK